MTAVTEDSEAGKTAPDDAVRPEPHDDEKEQEEEVDDEEEASDGDGVPNSPSRTVATESSSTKRKLVEMPRPGSLAMTRIHDILDFESEHILFGGRQSRNAHYDCLSYFWRLYPCRHITHGRRYALLLMVELLCVVCGKPALPHSTPDDDKEEEEEEVKNQERALFDPLYTLSVDKWAEIEADLIKLRDILLRKDAMVNYDTPHDEIDERAHETDIARMQSKVFQDKYHLALRLIQIGKALSPIRRLLEEALDANLYNFNQVVGAKKIQEVMDVLSAIQDEAVQTIVMELFKEQGVDEESGSKIYVLKDDETVINCLDSKPFDLNKVQKRFETLILAMYTEVYKEDVSCLMKLGYTIEEGTVIEKILKAPREHRPDIAASRAVEDLRSKREALNTKHGEDPLEKSLVESERFSQNSRKRKKPRNENPRKRKSTAKDDEPLDAVKRNQKHKPDPDGSSSMLKLSMEDQMEQEEEEQEDRAQVALKKSNRKPRPIKQIPGEPGPDDGIFDEDGRVLRRLRWTDQEKDCVKEGVRRHGIGHWTQVKKDFAMILRNRTTVQIKDCWRTMIKKGEAHHPTPRGTKPKEPEDDDEEEESSPPRRRRQDRDDESEEGTTPSSTRVSV